MASRTLRLDQRQQRLSPHHVLHLRQKDLPARALALANAIGVTKRQLRELSSTSGCAIVARNRGVVQSFLNRPKYHVEGICITMAETHDFIVPGITRGHCQTPVHLGMTRAGSPLPMTSDRFRFLDHRER